MFCYENSPESAKNGTLNLLGTLPVTNGPSENDLHNLRLEFVKRVFSTYLQADWNQSEDEDEDEV